jgi:hypothetical protein
MKARMSRSAWIESILAQMEHADEGECVEWQGRSYGRVPVVYCPRDYVFPGSAQELRSVRPTLWSIKFEERPPPNMVIRPRCGNSLCVLDEHWQILSRETQAKEQSKRGELQTAKALVSKIRVRRLTAKLTEEAAEQIRLSTRSSREEALIHGVSQPTISAIRRHEMWAPVVAGASVFNSRTLGGK